MAENAEDAKGKNLKRKRSRLRVVGRWGVWVCTLLVLVSILVSVLVEPEVYIWHEQSDAKRTFRTWSTHFVDGRFVHYWGPQDTMEDVINRTVHLYDDGPPPPNPGWHMRFDSGFTQAGYFFLKDGSWFAPRLWSSDSSFEFRLDFPLLYPALIMIGWSGWFLPGVWRRRRFKQGCCIECGYSLEGLGGGVCPECGDGDEE